MVIMVGPLEGTFYGFDVEETRFTFADGATWRQIEPKICPAYLIEPVARIVYQSDVSLLEVEGMDDTVKVIREN